MELKLTGRTVLVTGASKGIGLCIAQWFAREGCNLRLAARSGDLLERAAADIRVLGINPGPILTDRVVRIAKKQAAQRFGDPSRYEELMRAYPFGRPGSCDEVAAATVFFASDLSGYTSGTIVTIDAGFSKRPAL